MQRHFVSGQRIRKLPTRALNEALDNTRNHDINGNRPGFTPVGGQYVVSVHNTNGDDLDQWTGIGLDVAMIDPADNEQSFRAGVGFDGVEPTHADHLDKFGVMISPTVDGQVGRALVRGTINLKVDVLHVEHQYVRPKDNVLGLLETCGAGGGRVLWPFPFTATGEQWATVELTPIDKPVYAYLLEDLPAASTSGSPLVLTPSTKTARIYSFDSAGVWYDTEDEIEVTNVFEGVTAEAGTPIVIAREHNRWMLDGIGCSIATIDLGI